MLVISNIIFVSLLIVAKCNNTYIQEWNVSTATVPNENIQTWDSYMIAAYNYSLNPDIITIIGSFWDTQRTMIRKYHLSTQTIEMFNDQLSIPVGAMYPNGYVQLHNKIYFTSIYFDSLSNANFFIYDMNDDSVIQAGLQYPKLSILSSNCYATDGYQYIYLIGGNSIAATSFQIFDTFSNRWSWGSSMNLARNSAACLYSHVNSMIYAFAGDTNGTIEQYSLSTNKWTLIDATVSNVAHIAFKTQDANTIFVINGRTPVKICNIFFIDTQSVYLCPGRKTIYNSKQFPNGGYYAQIYISHLQRFYTIAGYNTNTIQYAVMSSSSPINISASAKRTKIGERVPILMTVNPN